MPAKKYRVALTQEERQQLEKVALSNHRSVREKTRARILLLADTNHKDGSLKDAQIAGQLRCTSLRVSKVRQRASERGALASVWHKEQERRKARALDGEQEAHLVALACSAAPQGRKRWTLHLLKERLIQREVVQNIGMETIRRTLKKRTQAVAEEGLVHCAGAECGLRVRDARAGDGRRAGGVRAPV